jgi:hypothetical protein
VTIPAAARGQAERALRLAGAADALRETAALRPTTPEREALEQWLRPTRAALGAAEAEAARAAGRAMTLEQAVAYALADAPDAA